jgi:hypothetical protein
MESALAAWFMQARESNDSIDGTHLMVLHIVAHLGTANFCLPVNGSTDLREDTTLSTEFYQVRAGVLIQKL